MPTLPIYRSETRTPTPPLVDTGGPDVFHPIEKALLIGDAASRAYDEMEATRIAGGMSSELEGNLKIAEAQYGQPDVFAANAAQQTQATQQKWLGQAANSRIREKVIAKTADNIGKVESNIVFGAIRKKAKVAEGSYETNMENSAREYANLDEVGQQENIKKMAAQTQFMADTGVINGDRAAKDLREYPKMAKRHEANFEMEADPSLLLKNLAKGKYDILDPAERLILKRGANEFVRQGIADQERELKLDQRKADNNIQQMLDAHAPMTEVQSKLEEYTAKGIFGGSERAQWDNRLRNSEVKDTPAQVQNANKLLADFKSQYYTFNSVKRTRDLANAMRNDGRLGEAGASQILGFINQTQSHIAAEGRAMESAARARAGATTGSTSNAQPRQIIAENYPYDKSGSMSKAHKDDVARYNDLTSGKGKEVDRTAIAKQIRDDRAKTIKEKKAQAAVVNQLPPDEAAALKLLRSGK